MALHPRRGDVPVLLVTGFAGAGRTTLLARWLADPAFAACALVVNDLADRRLDVPRASAYPSATRFVDGGCACCSRRGALAEAIADLLDERARRKRKIPFERILVEASGLAHPGALLAEIASDARVREGCFLHGVVAVVDASRGGEGLEAPEAREQVEAADAIVLAKTDLAKPAGVAAFASALARRNPDAAIVEAAGAEGDAGAVWDAVARAPRRGLRAVRAAFAAQEPPAAAQDAEQALAAAHGAGLRVHDIEVAAPVELSGFCVGLAGFLETHAPSVLRVKGLVPVDGRKRPAAIQAVGRTLYPVRTLRQWPSQAREGRLFVLARALDPAPLRATLPTRR